MEYASYYKRHLTGAHDGIPKNLKIKNKERLVLYDASKTAGVDYDKDTDGDNNESTQ